MGPKGGGGLGIKMRGAMHIGTIAIVVIMLCASHSGSAHEIKQEQYSHEELVSDVNALGTRFHQTVYRIRTLFLFLALLAPR
jgi:hypothetical protein